MCRVEGVDEIGLGLWWMLLYLFVGGYVFPLESMVVYLCRSHTNSISKNLWRWMECS